MRAGWHPDLEARVRAVPMTARLMVEAQVVTAADLRQRKEQWAAADSTAGFTIADDGSVRLAAATQVLGEQTTDSSVHHINLSKLTDAGPYDVARIDWQGGEPDDIEIRRITARLDPKDNDLNPQDVATWICRLWAVAEVGDPTGAQEVLRLVPIGDAAAIAAGPTEGDVVFDFSTGPTLPTPKRIRPIDHTDSVRWPVTFVVIYGITSTGAIAGNVAWLAGGGTQTGTNPISGRRLDDSPDLAGAFDELSTITTPRLKIETGSFAQATLAFTQPGNQLDLGAAPAAGNLVEFTAKADVPEGAAVTFQVRNDADTGWVTFVDGDTVDALAGVTAKQAYKVQMIVDPNAAGNLTPVLRGVGVRALTRHDLSDVATIQGGGVGFDPKTFEGQISNPQLIALRDGELDFQDAITELLANNDLVDVLIRVWVGADDLPRSQWLHKDDFQILDDRGLEGAIAIDLIPPIHLLDVDLPRFDEVEETVSVLQYTNATLKAAYDDLLTQAEIPGRYRGPGVEDTSETVSKAITGSTALTELNAIARLAQGAVITSQGQLKFVSVLGKKAIRAIFPREEIRQGAVTPGWQHRVPEFLVPYSWNPTRNEFDQWLRVADGNALLKVDRAPMTAEQQLPKGTAEWITTQTLAERVGHDVVDHRATGLILVPVSSTYAYPELEPGDLVAVETDRFVAKDPNTGRALRGRLWMPGVIQEAQDVWGTEFVVWVRSYADIVSITGTAESVGFAHPRMGNLVLSVDATGAVLAVLHAEDAASVRLASSTTATPSRTTVEAATPQALDAEGNLTTGTLETLAPGETCYVAGLAYERADGTGAESTLLITAEIDRAAATPDAVLTVHQRGDHAFLVVHAGTGYASFKWAVSAAGYPAAGTGTVVNAQDAIVDAGAFFYGDTIYVTVTPYTGTSATGTAGSPMRRRSQLRMEENQLESATGKRKRAAQFDDAKYAAAASATDGLTLDTGVKESGGKVVNRLFAKTLAADADDFSSIPDDALGTWRKVTGVSTGNQAQTASIADLAVSTAKIAAGAVTSGKTNIISIDSSIGKVKRAVTFDDAKYAAAASATDGLTLDTGVKESGARAVNRLFAKTLAADPDTLDSIADGTTYARILASRLSSGVLKRAGAFDDGGYALRAQDAAGKEAFDDVWIPTAKGIKVGTIASPSYLTKTLRLHATQLVPSLDSDDWAYDTSYVRKRQNNQPFVSLNLIGSLFFAPGTTITAIKAHLYRATVSDVAEMRFYRVTGDGVTTLLATLTHSTTGWQTRSITLGTPESVSASNAYVVVAELGPETNAIDARFSWLEITYRRADYGDAI